MNKVWKVGVLGATGQVGREIVKLLIDRSFPYEELVVFAGPDSAGIEDAFGHVMQNPDAQSIAALDLLFVATPGQVAGPFVDGVLERGGIVINLSSTRYGTRDMWIVPEVNGDLLSGTGGRVWTSPRPVAVALSVVLDALRDAGVPVRVSGTALLPASTEGNAGVRELAEQTIALLNQSSIPGSVFPQRLAFNVLPGLPSSENSTEGLKQMECSLREVLGEEELMIDLGVVTVPVFMGVGVEVSIEFEDEITVEGFRECLGHVDGLHLAGMDGPGQGPTLADAPESNGIWVGQIRQVDGQTIRCWLTFDNLRKGSAWNALQIAQKLLVNSLN